MKSMDDILTNALTPSEEPEFRLNQSIIAQAKEDHSMKPNKIKKLHALRRLSLPQVPYPFTPHENCCSPKPWRNILQIPGCLMPFPEKTPFLSMKHKATADMT